MFLKQTSYKPRSNSQASAGSGEGAAKDISGNGNPQAGIQGGASSQPTAANNSTGATSGQRRRSSVGIGGGLSNQKRNSQGGGVAGFMDQKPGTQGVIGGLWDKFTKGT